MIDSTKINTFVETGDRVQISVDGATYTGFVESVSDGSIILEWRDTEIMSINGKFQEGMVTKRCLLDIDSIKDIIKVT